MLELQQRPRRDSELGVSAAARLDVNAGDSVELAASTPAVVERQRHGVGLGSPHADSTIFR